MSAKNVDTYTYASTFVTCRDCGYRLELCQDDENAAMYYDYADCGAEWTLDGKKRTK